MKEFKIFIASSNDEKEERDAIKNFLLIINKETREFGIGLTPVMWEMESVKFLQGFSEKQNEYNDKLITSNMAFFLFGKRIGQYTLEEFSISWGIR